jgi:hypothetical protein
MTPYEWQNATDPEAMLRWLSKQGYVEALWSFTVAGCRRVWDKLPGPHFRKVVEVGAQLGQGMATWHMVDDSLADASRALKRLERKYSKMEDPSEQAEVNRRIGAAQIVFAFEFQDGREAALSVSKNLIEWATDIKAEMSVQVSLLRDLVPDPSLKTE